MKVKNVIQNGYNLLRGCQLFNKATNFLISSERRYQATVSEIVNKILERLPKHQTGNYVVLGGIFSGLQWPKVTLVGSEFIPKVIGTYEIEIQKYFKRFICDSSVTAFVDVGAAEGYYAVGAALLRSDINVYAYEIQSDTHDDIANLARVNSVSERVHIDSQFVLETAPTKEFGGKPLIMIDVEGAELDIINATFCNKFRKALLLIEVHDFINPCIGHSIYNVLSQSHSIEKVKFKQKMRQPRDKSFSGFEWMCATDEKRPRSGCYWLVAQPRLL